MKKIKSLVAFVLAAMMVLSFAVIGASADSIAITNITYTVDEGYAYFSVVTTEGYDRVKIAYASDPSTSLGVGKVGVANGDGTITWTVKLTAPTEETEFVFDARDSQTLKFTKTYYQLRFVPQTKDCAVNSVTHTVEDGYAYFSVVTDAGYDRVKIAYASDPSTSLGVGKVGVTNSDGTITWTVKLAEPAKETEFIFDARDSQTLKFTKEYFGYTFVPSAEPEKAVKSVEVSEEDGNLYFSVVTLPGYDRVKIAYASDPSTSLAVGKVGVTNSDGTITWTVKLADPKKETAFVFDARDSQTLKFTKDYFDYTYTPTAEPEKAVKSVESYIEAGMLYFSVVTGAGYNRVKVALASNPSGSLAISDKCTDNGNGTFTWLVKITNPEKAENYVFDARLAETFKYTKDYFDYSYTPSVEVAPFQSVSAELAGDKVILTVVTDAIFNRVKVASYDNPNGYIKYTNDFTDLGNGTYQWVLTFDAPESETKYLLDGRYSATNKYAKENYEYTLVIEEQGVIKSVDFEEADGNAVFTVVTSSKYNRVKVSLAADTSTHIKYTNDFTTLANGDRQWILTIAMPEETTEYSFDARLISTSKYTKEYYNYTVTVEAPIVSPFVSQNITVGTFYANIFTVTTDGCDRIVVSYNDKSETVTAYTTNAQGYRVIVCSVPTPDTDTIFSVDMLDENGRVLDTQSVVCYVGDIDHEIIS